LKLDNPNLLAPCGVNCGVCPYLIAYKNNDDRLKQKLAKSIGIKPEDIICEGCNSELPIFFCKSCKIKECVRNKGFESCAECEEYPCNIIERFPFKEFIKRQMWDINYRKKFGKDQWISITTELNTCPTCQSIQHWRARICKSCGTELKERYL
jgi:hypothetical protein